MSMTFLTVNHVYDLFNRNCVCEFSDYILCVWIFLLEIESMNILTVNYVYEFSDSKLCQWIFWLKIVSMICSSTKMN